ncbi:MAG: hypothetical protein ACRESK_03890 [Gammaproteobacteria bacterium]
MKKTLTIPLFLAALLLLSTAAMAGSPQVSKGDTIQTVLTAQKGKQATVKLVSGDELTGKVGEVTDKLVLLQALSGKEFYDAVINMRDIAAVLVRNQE